MSQSQIASAHSSGRAAWMIAVAAAAFLATFNDTFLNVAFAPTFSVLLIARLLQAIGTGLLTPIGMNITWLSPHGPP